MDYYVSLLGDDSNTGASETQPWRSIDRVNAAQLLPGDFVWFRANQTFVGNLCLQGSRHTPCAVTESSKHTSSVVTIGSYGIGSATINAGSGPGFIAKNRGGVHLVNLNFVGAGALKNNASGVLFINTLPGSIKLEDIRMHRVDVSGFKYSGISLVAQPTDMRWSGFRDVKITNTTSHDNGDAGISCTGPWHPDQKGYAHADFYIGNCSAYRNAGISGKGSHSGSGIVLAQVDGAIIEHCRAYENGNLNDYEGGGPVGIWTWDANRVVIQFNESHHNRTGSSKDGGGFDLDGGVTNSVVQYNYSHDNDGAGYLLAQFEGARPFYGNVLRYNLSVNDGRRNRYGGIHLWSTGSNGGITDTYFYANAIYMSESTDGDPAGVDYTSDAIRNIRFYNNRFQTDGNAVLVRGKTNRGATFEGNTFDTNYRFPKFPVSDMRSCYLTEAARKKYPKTLRQ